MFFQTDIHLYELLFVQIADHFLDELVHCLVYKTSRKIFKKSYYPRAQDNIISYLRDSP